MKPRHPGASRDPEPQPQPPFSWIPAYAGMTPLRQKNSVTEPLVARPFCFADNRPRSGAVQRRVVKAMTEPVTFKYRAFISYSHADTAWAKWLHRALENLRIDKDLAGRETATGTVPNSLRPVFRDRDDFTAGHTLTNQNSRRARRVGGSRRHLLAPSGQEPLRQRGDQALQVAVSRKARHPADRRRQARR